MHYFVDGYNMLFRLKHGRGDLQRQREQIIYDLNEKAALANLNISIVFDAYFQLGEGSRSHFDSVEILFTAKGQTADEFIIKEISRSLHPRRETVVTSDKDLAWHAKRLHAHTETVEGFLERLNKTHQKKQKQVSTPLPKELTPVAKAAPEIVVKQERSISIPSPKASLEESFEYYSYVFEERYQELVKEEGERKKPETSSGKKKRKRSINIPEPVDPETKAASEMERWLKIFETERPEEP